MIKILDDSKLSLKFNIAEKSAGYSQKARVLIEVLLRRIFTYQTPCTNKQKEFCQRSRERYNLNYFVKLLLRESFPCQEIFHRPHHEFHRKPRQELKKNDR